MESRPSPQHSSTASGNQSTESFATCNEDELAVSSFLSRLHVRSRLSLGCVCTCTCECACARCRPVYMLVFVICSLVCQR